MGLYVFKIYDHLLLNATEYKIRCGCVNCAGKQGASFELNYYISKESYHNDKELIHLQDQMMYDAAKAHDNWIGGSCVNLESLDASKIQSGSIHAGHPGEGVTINSGGFIHHDTGITLNLAEPETDFAGISEELPGLSHKVFMPCECTVDTFKAVGLIIIHLNDYHEWSYTEIADFLDTVDDPYNGIDLSFKGVADVR